jgi:hypothetical protein
MHYKKSLIGGTIAFTIATSCCWLPALLIAIGGGSALMTISKGLEKYSGIFIIIGFVFLVLGIYQYQKRNKNKKDDKAVLKTLITCPGCSYQKEEIMPTNACQYFYECENCKLILKPKNKDCCVYCSYATLPCPPIQLNQNCC